MKRHNHSLQMVVDEGLHFCTRIEHVDTLIIHYGIGTSRVIS